MKLEPNNDFVKIKEILGSLLVPTYEYYDEGPYVLTGSMTGTVYSRSWEKGEVRITIEFTTDASGNCSTNSSYSGFKLIIYEDENRNTLPNTLFTGNIKGSSTGGALRFQSYYGYLDLGPKRQLCPSFYRPKQIFIQ